MSARPPGRPPGRPRGTSDTREEILEAARRAFGTRGYDGVSIRALAADAGVDPALVHHYFGTKDGVFVAAVGFPIDLADLSATLAAGDDSTLGERLVRVVLRVWSEPGGRDQALALIRSAASQEHAAALLRQFMSRALIARVAPLLPETPDRELRVTAAASQLVGLAFVRYIVRVEPLASASDDEVVALIGPAVQHHLLG